MQVDTVVGRVLNDLAIKHNLTFDEVFTIVDSRFREINNVMKDTVENYNIETNTHLVNRMNIYPLGCFKIYEKYFEKFNRNKIDFGIEEITVLLSKKGRFVND